MDDHQLAAELAEKTGQFLVELRADLIREYTNPWVLKSMGDAAAHQYIVQTLTAERPYDHVLSEEGLQGDYSHNKRVWIVDPLDGTREFGEPPRDDWAVHIALVEEGALEVGAVSIPERQQIFSTANPPPQPKPPEEKIKVAVSRTRPGRAAGALYQTLEVELLPMGSAGVKTMAVVEGTADVYIHSGGQNEWDTAAPVAVAHAAGLWTSDLAGEDLVYNKPDPFVENFIICKPEIAQTCLDIMKLAGF